METYGTFHSVMLDPHDSVAMRIFLRYCFWKGTAQEKLTPARIVNSFETINKKTVVEFESEDIAQGMLQQYTEAKAKSQDSSGWFVISGSDGEYVRRAKEDGGIVWSLAKSRAARYSSYDLAASIIENHKLIGATVVKVET